MKLKWGTQANAADPLAEAPGSLVAAAMLAAYLFVWLPMMCAFLGALALAALGTALLVLFSWPCWLWGRVVAPGRRPPPKPRENKL